MRVHIEHVCNQLVANLNNQNAACIREMTLTFTDLWSIMLKVKVVRGFEAGFKFAMGVGGGTVKICFIFWKFNMALKKAGG